MAELSYDLHIHSCLSPCGDNESTPYNIAGMAAVQELDVFALCDHNTARNCPAAAAAAERYGVLFVPGMELTTAEEVHVVCLFADVYSALQFDKLVYSRLIKVPNRPDIFGDQLLYDENDRVAGVESSLLINATDIEFSEAFRLVAEYNGAAFPAHIDKDAYSLFSNLGFIPPDADFKAAEVKDFSKFEKLKTLYPELEGYRLLKNSDAHRLEDINPPDNVIDISRASPAAVVEYLKKF